MDPTLQAVLILGAVGLALAVWGEIQERGFQKEIRRQKELGIYPYAPGQHPDEIAERPRRIHPAE